MEEKGAEADGSRRKQKRLDLLRRKWDVQGWQTRPWSSKSLSIQDGLVSKSRSYLTRGIKSI